MAKLTVFAAVLAALITLSTASAYTTTTVVTTEIINPHQSCEREIQRMRMTHCMQYLQTGMGGRAYEPSFLRSEVANKEEEHLEECCDEMRSISSPCRGDAVRQMIVEIKERYGMEEMEMQKMMVEKARVLPHKCNLKSSPTMF